MLVWDSIPKTKIITSNDHIFTRVVRDNFTGIKANLIDRA